MGDEIAGLPLGVFDRPYEEQVVPLDAGDVWFFCTDGVTEARNPAGELYGDDRLRAALRAASADVPGTGQALLADVLGAADGRSVLLVTHRPEGLDLVDEVVALDGVADIRASA